MIADLAEETYELLDALVLHLSEFEDERPESVELLGRVIALRTDLMDELGMFEESHPEK